MALGRASAVSARHFIAGFPVFSRMPFVQSGAYTLLTEELRRYTLGFARGRSFLIAGHRGSGKTALVRQVVEAGQITALTASKMHIPPGELPQRPLLVQLYGPSLVSGTVPGEKTPEEKPAPGAPTVLVHINPQGEAASPETKPGAGSEKPAELAKDALAKGALVQITIALYRAVADEFAQSVACHAAAAPSGAQPELQELAAQLRLDLDMGADAMRLRMMWQRLGRLADGVLWPGSAPMVSGQGVGEIAALVTVAQAFQVCTGKVDLKQSDMGNAKRDESVEVKGESGLKEFGDKLLSLAAGLGVGAAAATKTEPLLAALAGVGAALLSSVTLSWSNKRSQGREISTDYSFLPDRSVETLDRDLPMVIRRLRDVGLAPVFVVDELDKLDPEKIGTAMASLIDRLKLLLTDHAFFCFLADRAYFDRVEAAIEKDPYGREHTYYNDRLFIEYRATQLATYVTESTTAADDTDRLAQLILGRYLLHRAELNFIRLIRAMSQFWDAGDVGRVGSDHICTGAEYQAHAVIQLAVEHMLNSPALGPRVEEDPGFAQLANDALYMISRAWLDEEPEISVYRAAVVSHLLGCLGLKATPEESEKTLLGEVSKAKLDDLAKAAANLARLLADFSQLRAVLIGAGRLAGREEALLGVFNTLPGPGLLEPVADLKFRFKLDKYGIAREGLDSPPPGEEIPPALYARVEDSHAYVEALRQALEEAGIDPVALSSAGLLPLTLGWGEIMAATGRLGTALGTRIAYVGLGADLQLGESLTKTLAQMSSGLSLILRLAVALTYVLLVGGAAKVGMSLSLKACGRHLGDQWSKILAGGAGAEIAIRQVADGLAEPILKQKVGPGFRTSAALGEWQLDIRALKEACVARKPFDLLAMTDSSWAAWRLRVVNFLANVQGKSSDLPRFEDLLVAAADLLPSRLFRADLAAMLPWEWSLLVLESARQASTDPPSPAWTVGRDQSLQEVMRANPDPSVPSWGVLAGLRALGFDGQLLTILAGPAEIGLGEFAQGALPAKQGVLNIVENFDLVGAAQPSDIPILWVHQDDLERYDAALLWLRSLGVISQDEVGYGRDKLSGHPQDHEGS